MLNTAYRRTLRKAFADLKAGGHETFVMISLVPGKVGLEEDAAQFASKMEKVATVVAVIHGREDGGDFAQFDELKQDYDFAEVPNDHSAILDLITEAGVTPFDWCATPVPGFSQAAAWMASNLHKLASQPTMIKVIGTDAAVPVLANLSQGRPKRSYNGRNARWQVRDEVLTADAAMIAADEALRGVGGDATDTDVVRLARDYIAASSHRDATYRAAKRKVP